MVIVTGATGNIGSELVRLLAWDGVAVRALSRRREHGERLPGVEWMRADLGDRESLATTFAGGDRLFLLTDNGESMVRLQKNAIRAAVDAGVEHVVKLSALGASDHSKSLIGVWHFNVERELRDSGVAWTMLRPHHFMQNLLDPLVFDRERGAVYSASGEGRIPFIDTRDIAAAARVALTEPGHERQVYFLTGPDALSYRDVTSAITRATGRDLEYVVEDVDDAWRRLRAAGEPAWRIAALLAIAEYQRAGGPTERVTDTVAKLTGVPARTIEQFCGDHHDDLARNRQTAKPRNGRPGAIADRDRG